MENQLLVFEQFRYDSLLIAFNNYFPPSVCKLCIKQLDELVSSLLEDVDSSKR